MIGTGRNFSICSIRVFPSMNRLERHGKTYALEPKVMDVLCCLASRAPQVLSRDQIIDQVWGGQYGRDESLTRAISVLRRTFKQAGLGEPIIKTVSKRGYYLAFEADFGQEVFETKPSRMLIVNKKSYTVDLQYQWRTAS